MSSFLHAAPKRILILRALQIGDWLCTIPAIRALKKALPESEITLLGLPWSKDFVSRFSDYFSHFEHFPGYPSFPEQEFQLKSFMEFLPKIQKEAYDVVLQMQGNGSDATTLCHLFGAKRVGGFYTEGQFKPDREWSLPYPDTMHEIHRHMALMEHLGIPLDADELEFPIKESEWGEYSTFALEHGLEKGRYVCIHPGSRATARRWDPKYFALAADQIMSNGYKVVVTGTGVEEENIRQMVAAMKREPIVALNAFSLGGFGAVLSHAKLLLSNDTGASHIAAATKTPSVVIFLASPPSQWAPLNRQLHEVILSEQAQVEYVIRKMEEKL